MAYLPRGGLEDSQSIFANVHCTLGFNTFLYVAHSSESFLMNSSRVISPLSINSFASASVCARLETISSSSVTGLLSGFAIVLSSFDYLFRSHEHHRGNRQAKCLGS